MDILIPDDWLRDYLETKVTPEKFADCLSLCGPSVERILKKGKTAVYSIEVTTNRVDSASVYGIAREAQAILPQFGFKALVKTIDLTKSSSNKKLDIKFQADEKLVSRISAVLLTNVSVKDSPNDIKTRLENVGQRALNNVIDITNYVMYGFGTPLHAFDYDKLTNKKIVVREAKKGEKLVTLDGVERKMHGGEVVFDDGKGILIDLPGIMGAENTKVTSKTKNVLLLSEHIDPLRIREASLTHELRTQAAVLNEKNVDPDSIPTAIKYAIDLFERYAGAVVSSEVYDWYPKPQKRNVISITHDEIEKLLGISLSKQEITKILTDLDFNPKWKNNELSIVPPSYRAADVSIKEDIVEEIARIYGYFKLPSNLPEGSLPNEARNPQFIFESKVKNILKSHGGVEVYTLSMVSKQMADENALHIKNPLGSDGEYMRTSLVPSLVNAANDNSHEKENYYLFELANVYLPNGKKLPYEQMNLGVIFANSDFRYAKGILEALFEELNIEGEPKMTKAGNYWTYEAKISELMQESKPSRTFQPIPKFPAQVEDMTLVLDEPIKAKDLMKSILKVSDLITKVELKDTYKDTYTFRIHYQDVNKTLTNDEVAKVRGELILHLKSHFAISVK